jgi:threo-3-hydroxy-L-aspartate ammonia-lyase
VSDATTSSPDVAARARALGPADVEAAAARIAGRVVKTPTVRCPVLDERAGAQLWLKCENLQRIGAFKARGAMHAVARLAEEQRRKGVITFSSGNHAQAVALAAREYGVPAAIAMPTDAPAIKVEGVRRLDAEVVFAGTTSDDRRRAALEIQARTGGVIIQPFDHPDIVCGQGTATRELLEDVDAATDGEGLDALVVPVGGGGVIAGACVATRGRRIAIYSAEPHGCDAMARSIEAGERVSVQPGPTLADGLKPVQVGALNFEIARTDLAGCERVDDEEIGRALVGLLIRAKLLVEPSGAAGLAVALRGLPGSPRRIGVILTGGNVDPLVLSQILERHAGEA